jgi:hypothetical protein
MYMPYITLYSSPSRGSPSCVNYYVATEEEIFSGRPHSVEEISVWRGAKEAEA